MSRAGRELVAGALTLVVLAGAGCALPPGRPPRPPRLPVCWSGGSSSVPPRTTDRTEAQCPALATLAPQIAALRPAMESCYEAALGRDPDAWGDVRGRVVFRDDGAVGGACVTGSDIADAELVDCLVEQLSTLRIAPQNPATCGGLTVVVPVHLERRGD